MGASGRRIPGGLPRVPSDPLRTLRAMGIRRGSRPAGVEACPVCDRTLGQPVWWRRLSGDRWLIVMRCPDCAAEYGEELDDVRVKELDDHLHRHRAYLEAHLAAIETADATAEVERFVDALARDEVTPDDFADR
jgi:hypothetical protein